jgi:fibronectin-binding autotransporter adhesin
VRQNFTGNGEMIARIASMDHTNPDSKAGVMMRDSTTTTSPYALACVTASSGVSFHYRATESTAAAVKATINGIAAPCWVRLVRTGSNFTAFYATDTNGVAGPWLPIGTAQSITFPGATNVVGLAVGSKVDASVCTAVFDQLGGTIDLGGERTVTVTPASAASGTAIVTLTANDGATTTARTFNVLVDGAPPSTTVWNATAAGSLPWSTGTNWSGGTPPPNSRFSTVEFFTGQTFTAGAIVSDNDTPIGHALNVLTLGGTGPTTGTSTISITGNPIVLRRETVLLPVINLTATNGTGLTYNVSAPVMLDDTTTAQGTGTATFILSGGVGGMGGLTKTGSSRLILAGANTYAGTTTISGGILQIGSDGATGTLAAGDVINNATLRFDRTGTLLVPNNISGTGGLTLDCPISAGTVVLSGSNSFTGNVNVASGALRITNSSALGAAVPAGTKTITLTNGTAGNPQLRLDGTGGDIDLAATIRFTTSNVNGAIINEAGNNILRGNFTLTSGGGDTKILVNADSLTLEGNIAPNNTGRALQLSGAGNGTSTGIISNGTASQLLALVKNDGGTWTVTGANTYSGLTTVNLGTLRIGHPSALGNGIGATAVASGGTLDLNGQAGVNEVITLNGAGAGGIGALVNQSVTPAAIANGITSVSLTAGGTHSAVPSVTISGTGAGATATATLGVTAASFTISGGTTVYSAAPTVTISGGGGTGATATAVLTGGVVSGIAITNAGTGYTTAPTIAFSAGTVTTAGTNPTGTGNATNFTLATNTSIGGTGDIALDAPVAGPSALTKLGNGTLTLNAANTYSGTTTINAGRLVLAGSVSGAVVVAGGIFQGSGTVAGNVTINGGVHASGSSPGIMSTAGNYTLAAGGMLQVDINGPAVGTQYDQVRTQGAASTVTLAGTLDLVAAPGLAAGTSFTIIENSGPAAVSGTFAGKPQNAEFYEDGQWWRISYTGGSGNDVVLTRITPTPWQNWLAANFGANTNNAAFTGDLLDVERDGLVNLLEYALGGNPNLAFSAALPRSIIAGGKLAITFTRTVANSDITITVQAGDSPAGPWTDIARSTSGTAFTALAGGSVTESGTGATRGVEVRDIYLLTDPAHPRRFLRVAASRP